MMPAFAMLSAIVQHICRVSPSVVFPTVDQRAAIDAKGRPPGGVGPTGSGPVVLQPWPIRRGSGTTTGCNATVARGDSTQIERDSRPARPPGPGS